MVVIYRYENFREVKQGRKYKDRLKKKAIQKYRQMYGSWTIKDSDINRAIIDYLRHNKTHYEDAIKYAESKEEYVLLKLMVMANIGASFEHLSHSVCKQMMEIIKKHTEDKLKVDQYYSWWERVKRAFRSLFGINKVKAL